MKKFSSDFRSRVATVVKSGVSPREAGSALGISLSQVQKWSKKYASKPQKLSSVAAHKELVSLKSQLQQALKESVFDESDALGSSSSSDDFSIKIGSLPEVNNPASPVDGTNSITVGYGDSSGALMQTLAFTNKTGPSLLYIVGSLNPTNQTFQIGGKQPFPGLGFASENLQVKGTDVDGNTGQSNVASVSGKVLTTAGIQKTITNSAPDWGNTASLTILSGLGSAVTKLASLTGLAETQTNAIIASFTQYLDTTNFSLTLSSAVSSSIQVFPSAQNISKPWGWSVSATPMFSSPSYSGISVDGGAGFSGMGGPGAVISGSISPYVQINWAVQPQVNVNLSLTIKQTWSGSTFQVSPALGGAFTFNF